MNIKTVPNSIRILDGTVGLAEVKKKAHEIYDLCMFDTLRGHTDGDRRCPNFLFVGNPGTGKTSVAKRWGEILRDCGILTSGHVFVADRSSLVGSYIGQTAKLVKGACRSALHGVLFIDEAYALVTKGSDKDFGHEAISTLIKEIEDHKNEMVVILAGYPDLMDEFIKTNPGLQSRFTEVIHFDDYTDDELAEIGRRYCIRHGFTLSLDGKRAFIETINRRRCSDRFGNARDAEQILEDAFRRKAANFFAEDSERDDMRAIDRNCFPVADETDTATDYLRRLEGMIGLKKAKVTLRRIIDNAVYEKEEADLGYREKADTPICGHYCFVGNPGTGKTSVARLFGKILHSYGITRTDIFIEASRQDLVAGYCGQTAIKTKEVCEKAYGGILFIDEAYSLVQDPKDNFGLEALATLLKEMEDNRDRLIVIFAGYKKEMEAFLKANTGLRSRITEIVVFDDYSEAELLNIFIKWEDQYNVVCSPESQTVIIRKIHEIYTGRDEYFGNGREMRRLFESIYARMKSRVVRQNLTDRYERHLIIEEDAA